MTTWLIKLLPGALAILLLGGLGFYLGRISRQPEIDQLNNTVQSFRRIDQEMSSLKASVDQGIRIQNETIFKQYNADLLVLTQHFNEARDSLSTASKDLMQRGATVRRSLSAMQDDIKRLPAGSERDKKMAELMGLLARADNTAALCADTPIPSGPMLDTLKMALNLETAKK